MLQLSIFTRDAHCSVNNDPNPIVNVASYMAPHIDLPQAPIVDSKSSNLRCGNRFMLS